jgi:hypothetical protein
MFVAYDPISLNTANDGSYSYYHWVGYDEANSPYQTLLWFDIPVGVEEENEKKTIPAEFSLSQNYPNPFNPTTIIKFTIPQSPPFAKGGNIGVVVTLKVYDVLGNEIATLVNEEKQAGKYEIEFIPGSGIWNLASGIYFYQLKAGSFIQTKKMLLLK